MRKSSRDVLTDLEVDRMWRLNARYPWMKDDINRLKCALENLLAEKPYLVGHVEVFKLFYGVGCVPHSLGEIMRFKGYKNRSMVSRRKEEVEGCLQAERHWK